MENILYSTNSDNNYHRSIDDTEIKIAVLQCKMDDTIEKLTAIDEKLDKITEELLLYKGAMEAKKSFKNTILTILQIIVSAGIGGYIVKAFGI